MRELTKCEKGAIVIDLSPRSLIKMLEKAGYVQVRQSGSHKIFAKDDKTPITVPDHGGKDIKRGTYLAIMKQAGLK